MIVLLIALIILLITLIYNEKSSDIISARLGYLWDADYKFDFRFSLAHNVSRIYRIRNSLLKYKRLYKVAIISKNSLYKNCAILFKYCITPDGSYLNGKRTSRETVKVNL